MLLAVTTSTPLPPTAPRAEAASALLTLWVDEQGTWHASVVLPDGGRRVFDSPFELARWSRAAVPPLRVPGPGLR